MHIGFSLGIAALRRIAAAFGGLAPGLQSYFSGDFSTQANSANAVWPSACYDAASDQTFYVWIAEGSPQLCRIAAYDHTAGVWSEAVTIDRGVTVDDTHTNPAVCVDHEGYIYVFWGARGGAGCLWLISANPGDISAWNKQTTIATVGGLSYTYPKPVMFGTDLYLFMRSGATDDAKFIVRKASPSGGVASFGAEVNLIDWLADNIGIYVAEVRSTGTEIEFMACQNVSPGVRRHIYYFAWNPTTGALRNIDSTVTVASGSLPINNATAIASFREVDSGTNITEIPSWCRDADGDLHVVYFDGSANPYPLKHMIWDGTAWSTPATVVSLNGRGVPRIRYLSLAPAGANVEFWYPTGDTGGWSVIGGDDMARKVWTAGVWGSEEIIVTGDGVSAMAHPSSVHNSAAAVRVVFGESGQSELYNDRILAKRYAHGDSGITGWPAPANPYDSRVIEQVVYHGADNATRADADQSLIRNPVLWSGNAKIVGNRLALDGSGDYTSLESLVAASIRRYYMNGVANKNDGEFCFDLRRIKFNNATQTGAIWGRSGGSGQRSIIIIYRGELSPDQFSFEYSYNGSTLLNLRFDFTPDITKEYDFRISRDAAGVLRIHHAESGNDLAMVASASVGTDQLGTTTARVNHGSFNDTTNYFNGSIGATRVTISDRWTGDADVPAAEMEFDA